MIAFLSVLECFASRVIGCVLLNTIITESHYVGINKNINKLLLCLSLPAGGRPDGHHL